MLWTCALFCGSGICQEIGGLGGIKVFKCSALLSRCLVHPFGIQSHEAISKWRCCTLWAPAALTPATCETKDEINVQGNISFCQSCLLPLKEPQYSATQLKLTLVMFLSVTAGAPAGWGGLLQILFEAFYVSIPILFFNKHRNNC